jgi:hypothetical protein
MMSGIAWDGTSAPGIGKGSEADMILSGLLLVGFWMGFFRASASPAYPAIPVCLTVGWWSWVVLEALSVFIG